MFGVWFRTPGWPSLNAIWADIGRRITYGPTGRACSEPDAIQILVQEEDAPPRDNQGGVIPQTDISLGAYAKEKWCLIPHPTYDDLEKPQNGN